MLIIFIKYYNIYAMNGIERDLKAVLDSKIGKGKVFLLIGPRQVGKKTLL